VERRSRLRIYEAFPATVRGRDTDGKDFEIQTVLDNLGHEGLYVRLTRNVQRGAHLSVEVRLSSASDASVFAPRLAILGEVLRTEPHTDGSYGVAIEFHQRRLL